jgi:hypothetical protein
MYKRILICLYLNHDASTAQYINMSMHACASLRNPNNICMILSKLFCAGTLLWHLADRATYASIQRSRNIFTENRMQDSFNFTFFSYMELEASTFFNWQAYKMASPFFLHIQTTVLTATITILYGSHLHQQCHENSNWYQFLICVLEKWVHVTSVHIRSPHTTKTTELQVRPTLG